MSEYNNPNPYDSGLRGCVYLIGLFVVAIFIIWLIISVFFGFFAFLDDPAVLLGSLVRYEYSPPVAFGIYLFTLYFLLNYMPEKGKNMSRIGHFLRFCCASIAAAALTSLIIGAIVVIF